jgi:hypothetical protein
VAVDHPAWAAPSVYLGPTAEAPPIRVGGLGAWLDRLSDKPALEVGEREKLTSLLIRQTPPSTCPLFPALPHPHSSSTSSSPLASQLPPQAQPRRHPHSQHQKHRLANMSSSPDSGLGGSNSPSDSQMESLGPDQATLRTSPGSTDAYARSSPTSAPRIERPTLPVSSTSPLTLSPRLLPVVHQCQCRPGTSTPSRRLRASWPLPPMPTPRLTSTSSSSSLRTSKLRTRRRVATGSDAPSLLVFQTQHPCLRWLSAESPPIIPPTTISHPPPGPALSRPLTTRSAMHQLRTLSSLPFGSLTPPLRHPPAVSHCNQPCMAGPADLEQSIRPLLSVR